MNRLVIIIGCILGLIISLIILFSNTDNDTKQSHSPLILHVDAHTMYTPEAMHEDLNQLASVYPTWMRVDSIGKSHFGKDIAVVYLGHGRPQILIVGAHHGREWMTTMVLVKALAEYAKAASNNFELGGYDVSALLDAVTLIIVPMLNPDGVMIAQSGLPKGGDHALLENANEKNSDFTRWKANGRGVNLNIQYAANWEQAVSEPKPHYEKYKGPEPESERESRALAELVRDLEPEMVLAYHSSGQVIYWQYDQQDAQLIRDQKIGQEIASLTGYLLAVEPREDSHAGFKDWFIHKYQKPGFTIEIGSSVGDQSLPIAHFDQVWEKNKLVLLYVANLVAR